MLVVELTKPHLGPGGQTLAFRVKVLRGSPADPLREFAKRADRRVADRFGRVSLFVDASGQEVGLSFSFSGIPSGATVAIGFSNAQVDVTADAATDLFLESSVARRSSKSCRTASRSLPRARRSPPKS